jgi:hypothetical protein
MAAASRSPSSSDWREIASLGEQIISAASLTAQRDLIIAMTSQLVKGEVDVWLDEKIFHLPNLKEPTLFSEEPELAGMQRALRVRQLRTKQRRANSAQNWVSRATWVAVPLIEQGTVLGAIQVTRKKGPESA